MNQYHQGWRESSKMSLEKNLVRFDIEWNRVVGRGGGMQYCYRGGRMYMDFLLEGLKESNVRCEVTESTKVPPVSTTA